jgi:hypothetical protein
MITFSEINEFPAFFRNVETGEFMRVNKDRSAEAIKIFDTEDQTIVRSRVIKPLSPEAFVNSMLKQSVEAEASEFEMARRSIINKLVNDSI